VNIGHLGGDQHCGLFVRPRLVLLQPRKEAIGQADALAHLRQERGVQVQRADVVGIQDQRLEIVNFGRLVLRRSWSERLVVSAHSKERTQLVRKTGN
jgi:hypothetical protein